MRLHKFKLFNFHVCSDHAGHPTSKSDRIGPWDGESTKLPVDSLIRQYISIGGIKKRNFLRNNSTKTSFLKSSSEIRALRVA